MFVTGLLWLGLLAFIPLKSEGLSGGGLALIEKRAQLESELQTVQAEAYKQAHFDWKIARDAGVRAAHPGLPRKSEDGLRKEKIARLERDIQDITKQLKRQDG
jgi:hypothetical protein